MPCSLLGDDSLLGQIHFVAAQHNLRVRVVGVRAQLFQPVAYVQEGLLVGQVEHDQKAHGITEEGSGERTESALKPSSIQFNQVSTLVHLPFLASRVPELQVDSLTSTESTVMARFVNLVQSMCALGCTKNKHEKGRQF